MLIGEGDELTIEERERIWHYLLRYVDKDIYKEVGNRESFRMNTLFMRLGRYRFKEPLRHFFSMKDARGEEYHVLVGATHYSNPGNAFVEINVYRNTFPIGGTRFFVTPTSMNAGLGDISVEPDVAELGDVLKIETHFNHEVATLYYAFLPSDDDQGLKNRGMGLVRFTDAYGVPSGIHLRNMGKYAGPAFPLYWQKDCDRILSEGAVPEQLQFLLWLASDHEDMKGDGLGRGWPNAPDTASELRDYLKDQNLLQPFLNSENRWLRDAAQLALNKINGVHAHVGFEEDVLRAMKERQNRNLDIFGEPYDDSTEDPIGDSDSFIQSKETDQ